MIIYFKLINSIEGKICFDSLEHKLHFRVPLKEKSPVFVEIIPDENIVESFYEFKISTEMWNNIHNNSNIRDLSENLPNEFLEIQLDMLKAVKKVLSLIKYCFKCTDLHENLLSNTNFYWSKNNSDWEMISSPLHMTLNIRGFMKLNKESAKDIQKYIDNDFKPFFALRHLHRAINEKNPRYKWIDATIAAELAIKEFLIRRDPCIEALLLEIPAPPLYKLYGSILEKYNNGKKSPKFKAVEKGAHKRNKLIHKPEDTKISPEEADEYIHDIETAIYHLLYLLYQEDYKSYKYFPYRLSQKPKK